MARSCENTTAADSGVVVNPAAVHHLVPATLFPDPNVRHDNRLDSAFLASIKDVDVP